MLRVIVELDRHELIEYLEEMNVDSTKVDLQDEAVEVVNGLLQDVFTNHMCYGRNSIVVRGSDE